MIHQSITNHIIAELEQGTIPWTKPWNAIPHNAINKRQYRGINILLLWNRQFESREWLTAKQIRWCNFELRKQQTPTRIIFYKELMKDDKKQLVIQWFNVFNTEQLEEYDPPEFSHPSADEFLSTVPAQTIHGGDRAYYSPQMDLISLPNKQNFESYNHYLATRFHETVHWTHSRVGRKLSGKFGDAEYAYEELVAELGAAFLCGQMNVPGQLRHADYIAHWLTLLRKDKSAVLSAASKASQAVGHLNSYAQVEA